MLRLMFLLLLITVVRTPAQEAVPTPPPEDPDPPSEELNLPPEVAVRFSLFVWPTTGVMHRDAKLAPMPPLFYAGPGGTNRVHITRGNATPMLPYMGALPLELFDLREERIPPPQDAPPNTPPQRVYHRTPHIRADFPTHWKEVLLVTFPDKFQPDGTMVTLPMPYDVAELQPGKARFYNGTKHPFVLGFGDEKISFPPYEHVDIKPTEKSKHGFLRVTVYGSDRRGQAAAVYSRKVRVSDIKNNFYVVYPQGRNRIRMMFVGGHELPAEE